MVADNESGKSVMSEVRTSSGMFLQKGQVLFNHLSVQHLWTFSEIMRLNSLGSEWYKLNSDCLFLRRVKDSYKSVSV